MTQQRPVPKISSPAPGGGGGPRSGSEGAPHGPLPPTYHKDLFASSRSKQHAKSLRQEMTPPERRLWSHLRNRALAGFRFRRQHPLGPYIADFYCHDAGLVIEIDGASHAGEQKDHDERRDRWMAERGLAVLRVQAIDVRDNLEGVLRTIEREAVGRIGSLERTGGTPSDPSTRPR